MRMPQVFGLFAEIGSLYKAKGLNPLWSCHQEHEHDPWDSLALFLEGYAFERQGRRPDFSHVAADVIDELKSNGLKLNEATSPQIVWQRFSEKLHDDRLNPANNPVCPEGTAFAFAGHQRVTRQPSAVELAAKVWKEGEGVTLTSFARFDLQADIMQ